MLLSAKRGVVVLFIVLAFFSIAGLLGPRLNHSAWPMALLAKNSKVEPPITHIVLFRFKEGTSNTTIKQLTSKMLGLKQACVHPSTGYPYIKSIVGGKDNSNEDLQHGMSHAYILHFESIKDRDYYVSQDPAHQAFKEAAALVLENAQVVDFQDGSYT